MVGFVILCINVEIDIVRNRLMMDYSDEPSTIY